MIACPICDHEATQAWYCVERDGQIVPLKPVLDDGVWHCAACYNEFEVAMSEGRRAVRRRPE